MRVLKWLVIGCGFLVLLAGIALAGLLATSRGRPVADAVVRVIETDELQGGALDTSDEVLGYLVAHPDRFALAAWNIGDEDGGVFHDADRPWPLASTVKVLPLALASEKLAAGDWQLGDPTPEVEALYLPGTDGNAHPKAQSRLDGGTSTLDNTLKAMIRFSDNAATDAVLLRLGRAAVVEGSARLGGPDLSPPHPLAGDVLLAQQGFDGGALEDAAWNEAGRLLRDETYRKDVVEPLRRDGFVLSLERQEAMARTLDNRGSARAYAKLLERIFSGEPRYAVARERLSWPMESSGNAADFVMLATKGGSLPGVLTAAYYAETKAGQRRVLALFLHDLPFATWLGLARSFAQQKLERELLLQPDALERLKARLGRRSGTAQPP